MAACVSICETVLNYAYICDCGIIVYDRDGNIKFKSDDDKEIYSDKYIDGMGIPWQLPETRKIVRRDFKNNLSNIVDGKCVSYGTLTGEEKAISFIREGSVALDNNDIVTVYSDGLSNYLKEASFINQVLNFEKENFSFERRILLWNIKALMLESIMLKI